MKNRNVLKKIIEEDLSKEKNYNSIMKKINESFDKKPKLKLKYAYVIIALLLISVIGVSAVYATNVVKNYRVETKNLSNKNSNEYNILFDNKLDREYDSNLFKEDGYYTYEEIEEKLQLKLLKNKNFDSNMYYLTSLKINEEKISQANFWQVNNDKSTKTMSDKYWFNFRMNTKYSNEDTLVAKILSSDIKYKEHYIKSLDTVALIKLPGLSCGSTLIYFSYQDIIYNIVFNCSCFGVSEVSGSDVMFESEVYDFLEAFYLD